MTTHGKRGVRGSAKYHDTSGLSDFSVHTYTPRRIHAPRWGDKEPYIDDKHIWVTLRTRHAEVTLSLNDKNAESIGKALLEAVESVSREPTLCVGGADCSWGCKPSPEQIEAALNIVKPAKEGGHLR
mgnify:CR=1 FL=1